MRLDPITVAQMRQVDRLMVEEYGILLLQMMENAGRSLAVLARHMLGMNLDGDRAKRSPGSPAAGRRVVVLAGKGNNGGGGLVAARHLANAGALVTIALSDSPGELGEAPEHQRRSLLKMGIPGSDRRTEAERLPALLAEAELIIDALIGYSLRGAPHEPVASFIRATNAASAPRLALDIPSGLDGDSGTPYEPCIRADATLTLAWPKAGLLNPAALPYAGDLYLADISVPGAVYRAVGVEPGTLFAHGPVVPVIVHGSSWEPGFLSQPLS